MLREYKRRNQRSLKCCGIYYIKIVDTYCVSCKKNTANENSSDKRTRKKRSMFLSNCGVCDKKKQGSFKIKKQVD